MYEKLEFSRSHQLPLGQKQVINFWTGLTSLEASVMLFSFFLSLALKWDGGGDGDASLSSLLSDLSLSSTDSFGGDFSLVFLRGIGDGDLPLGFLAGEGDTERFLSLAVDLFLGDGEREEPEELEESYSELVESRRARARDLN